MPPEPPLPYQHPRQLIGRGGPAAGGALSLLGSALAIIGFLLPWVSCAGQPLSGVALAQQPGPQGENLGWLYVVPFLALGCLGLALAIIPLAAWRRVPLLVGGALSALLALLALGAAVPLAIVYNAITTGSDQIGATLGFGGAVLKLEDGFWLTAFGLLMVVLGAGLGVVAAVVGVLWPAARPRPER
jgi:hypothetical protein